MIGVPWGPWWAEWFMLHSNPGPTFHVSSSTRRLQMHTWVFSGLRVPQMWGQSLLTGTHFSRPESPVWVAAQPGHPGRGHVATWCWGLGVSGLGGEGAWAGASPAAWGAWALPVPVPGVHWAAHPLLLDVHVCPRASVFNNPETSRTFWKGSRQGSSGAGVRLCALLSRLL